MKIKTGLAALTIALLLIPGLARAEDKPMEAEAPITLTSPSAILCEASTGRVIFEKNADERRPVASVNKVMTILLTLEAIDEGRVSTEDRVLVSPRAASMGGSQAFLDAGESYPLGELLKAVIVASANDSAVALAEYLAGAEEAFVKLMNRRAKEMGLKNTKFTGCVGFDAEGHYSSAEDIAVMTAELMTKEYYRGWLLTWLDYLRGGETQLLNTNKLVRYYDGILGGKTGTTDGAGCCLAACAQRGDMRLVAVVLGCGEDPERFDKAEELLDYGFSGFERFTPETDSRELQPIPVQRGEAAEVKPIVKSLGDCIIKKGRSGSVKYEYTFVEELEAPVEKGQFLGEYLVTLDGAEVFRSDIVAREEVRRMSFGMYLLRVLGEIIAF